MKTHSPSKHTITSFAKRYKLKYFKDDTIVSDLIKRELEACLYDLLLDSEISTYKNGAICIANDIEGWGIEDDAYSNYEYVWIKADNINVDKGE